MVGGEHDQETTRARLPFEVLEEGGESLVECGEGGGALLAPWPIAVPDVVGARETDRQQIDCVVAAEVMLLDESTREDEGSQVGVRGSEKGIQ